MADSSNGKLEKAKRYALMNFDKWNDVTGFVADGTGYYYEICSCIEDAVEYGFGFANGVTAEEIEKRLTQTEREE